MSSAPCSLFGSIFKLAFGYNLVLCKVSTPCASSLCLCYGITFLLDFSAAPWHHSLPSTCVQARPSSNRGMNGAVQVQGAESERAGVVTQTPTCIAVPRENEQRRVRARPQVLGDALHVLAPGQRAGGSLSWPSLAQERACGNKAGVKLPSCSPGWSVGCTGRSQFLVRVSGTGEVGCTCPCSSTAHLHQPGAWAGIGAEEEEEPLCQAKFLCYPPGFLHGSVATACHFWDSPFTRFS